MLAQVRSGGIDFFTPSALVSRRSCRSPRSTPVGFAFADYKQVWTAMDGGLGAHVREALEKVRLHAFEKMWDNGFRQTTTSNKPIETAKDMDGLKIRVPVSPLSIAMFKALGLPRQRACSSARCTPRCRPRWSTRRRTRCRSSRSRSSTKCRSTARSPTTSGTASGSS
jgi:hypothetical protein